MDCDVVLLSPSNAGSIPQSQHSSGYSRGKTRLKYFPSSSRSAMQEDVVMFRRLIEISTETWQLPPKDPCPYCKAIRFANEPPGFCCASGKIEIQLPKMPDELWNLYAIDMTPLGVEFRRRCRTYNNSMAFTSIKMSYDEALAKAHRGVYTFKVQGIVRHYIHELTPKDGVPRHLQLYFYGTERELENRVSQSEGLDSAIVSLLVNILKNNPYHNFFTNLQNRSDLDTYAIVLRANPKLDPRVYNLPVVDHVAAIWNEGMGPALEQPRDIRVSLRSGGVRYVHYYYGCYDPLQYCLIFPYGEPGWYAGIPKKSCNVNLMLDPSEDNIEDPENDIIDPHMHGEVETLLAAEQNNLQKNYKKPSSIAMREYYCYLFQIRADDRTNILRTGRVIQQFQIDTYVKIETQRLDFLRHNQSRFEMRAESYHGIVESMTLDGVTSAKSIGKRILLPKTFIGGPRDMVKGAYVSDPKQYKNPNVTCNYQWTFRRDTSVMEGSNDSIPGCKLSFKTTSSCEFHNFLSTKTLINTACVIIADQEPRMVTVRGQGKLIREYAAVDTELEPFVVTFWEDSVSDEIYAKMEPISNRTPLLLLNFSVVPYYGLSLSSNAQSIVLDDSEDDMLIKLEKWKHENEEIINILVQSTDFFEKKVSHSPKQPLQMTTVKEILLTQENTHFNVKVKARLENEYQDYFYSSCPICSTKTVATFGAEFMCYSAPCKKMRIANRSFRFSLMVFDTTGQAEVCFLGKEAQKLLGLNPDEFYQKHYEMAQSDFLKEQLCNVVLLLKIKSRMFKDAPSFTVDAVEILQDDCDILSDRARVRHGDSSEQDNDKDIQVKNATNNKGKEKMYDENDVKQITDDAVGCILDDSSDDSKPISDEHGVSKDITKRTATIKSKKAFIGDHAQDSETEDHWFSENEDSFDNSEQLLDDFDEHENLSEPASDIPLSSEILKMKRRGRKNSPKSKNKVSMTMKDLQAGTVCEKNEQNLTTKIPSQTKIDQTKDKQIIKELSTKQLKKTRPNIPKKHGKKQPIVPETPPLKSRSGRTIKQRVLLD